ncbi:MAG: hypothetical protein ACRD59_11905 [Candidatus Acidiferrales bacterium]
MRILKSRVRTTTFALAAILAVIVFVSRSIGAEPKEPPPAGQAASLAAWDKIASVLQNPRCLNCHQLDSPLQGDERRVHIPRVVRGPDGHGVGAMRCGNCHNDMGNNNTSGTPGGLHWQLAPVSMLWQGLSAGDLCRAVKDPKLNGNRDGQALIKHMEDEPLVLYGWNPGKGREPVPISHEKTVEYVKIWVTGGMVCPN